MSWSYLPEPAEESTEACCSDTLPYALWKSLTTTGACCCSASATESSRGFPCGTTCARSTAGHGADMSTSCQADSLVRTSAPPEKAPESTERNPDFGERWRASFARFDRATSSWRTVQCSLFEGSAECSVTWPRSGMTVDGHAYQLPTAGRRTRGTESGFLPTPNACTISNDTNVQCSGDGRKKPNKLGWAVAAEMWRTPTAQQPGVRAERLVPTEGGVAGGMNRHFDKHTGRMAQIGLHHQVMLRTPKASDADKGGRGELLHQIKTGSPRGIPTPRANDAKKVGNIDATNPRNGLAGFVRMPPPASSDWKGSSKPGQRRGQLTDQTMEVIPAGGRMNPTFVEWLMGWPIGSTALSPLAMDRFREFVQQHGGF